MSRKTRVKLDHEGRWAIIEGLVKRDMLSAEELKEFISLILAEKGVGISYCYDYELWLPNAEKPSLLIHSIADVEAELVDITLLDGLSKRSGEVIHLQDYFGKSLSWHIGILLSYRSRFLRKLILTHSIGGRPLSSEVPLSMNDHSRVAKLIWKTYLQGRAQELLEKRMLA